MQLSGGGGGWALCCCLPLAVPPCLVIQYYCTLLKLTKRKMGCWDREEVLPVYAFFSRYEQINSS
jgi:hypothetical protein